VNSGLEERRARALVERLPLVTYTLELEPPFASVYVSPQLRPLFGYSAAECLGRHDFWSSRVAPDDLPRFRAALENLYRTHDPMSVEYRVTASDGREVWVRDVGVVARDDDDALYIHGYFTDVTREKELERALAAERAQAEAFFRDSPVGLGITDADGRYVRVNEALARINGAPAAEHVGRTLGEIAPEIADRVAPILAEVQRTGVAIREQEVEVGAGGRRRAALASFFAIETPGRTEYGRIVMDITDQRRAEAESKAAERRYRQLIEQLPLVTYVNDIEPTYRTAYVSPQIEELFGYPAEEWFSNVDLWDRVVHPDDLAIVTRAEAEARERREPFELEYRVVRADGSIGWVLDRMETIYDQAGNATGERGFLIDVTELRQSERMFRAVFDNAYEAVILVDDEKRLVDVNPAACSLFGQGRDALVGLPFVTFAEPALDAPELWASFLERGELTGARSIVRADGGQRDVEFSAKAHVLPGRHLAVFRDVTERRTLERELSRAQKLESVGRLAGGVAQDFNNMLTAIRGYAQLLIARSSPGSPEHHHAGEIDHAAGRAATLTAQLLALGRRQTLQARLVDLNRLVEELGPMLEEVVGDTVEVTYDLEPGLCAARVDPVQIQQVLLSLLTNAADALGAAGSIVIRTTTATVGGGPDEPGPDVPAGRYAVIEVQDSGPGIDAAALEHLFEPFFTTKDVGDGIGLGLAAAYGFAKQSGGTIEVETAPGQGSTFLLYLPEAADGSHDDAAATEKG
jgi:PAS domain S-box-containing protein